MKVGVFALRHGTALVAAVFALALGGVFAARSLPSGVYPEVEFPRIVVVAHGGDDPADVFETQVTRPLEQSLVLAPSSYPVPPHSVHSLPRLMPAMRVHCFSFVQVQPKGEICLKIKK